MEPKIHKIGLPNDGIHDYLHVFSVEYIGLLPKYQPNHIFPRRTAPIQYGMMQFCSYLQQSLARMFNIYSMSPTCTPYVSFDSK